MKKRMWLFSGLSTLLVFSTVWADVTPGETITKDNLAQAETLLTPSTRWMVERGMPMTILETEKVEWPKAYKEATDKYSEQVMLSKDGAQLHNYIAGAPFPHIDLNDPQAGYKIIWNLEQNPFIVDNAGTGFINQLINSKGELERTYANIWRRMSWIGRLYTHPKPIAPHNPPLHHSNLIGPLIEPVEYKGLTLLAHTYLSPDTPDDTYVWVPEHRRVRRIGVASRGDPVWGTDFDVDSYWGFNAKISYWTFRLLAQKEILAVVHSGKYGDASAWCAPRDGTHGIVAALPCVLWEKRKVWVVEGTPTGYTSPYAYSKRIFYIDQDFYGQLLQEMYNRKGELWKSYFMCYYVTNKPYWGYPIWAGEKPSYEDEDEWPFIPNGMMLDLLAERATTFDAPPGGKAPPEWRREWQFNLAGKANSPDVYSVPYLIRTGK